MAGVAEKARFYLERSVPQLREWQDKEIFSKDEIRSIVQKRNDYEHKILSPGSTPFEWSSYAQWEQSLEALRSKRCQRLKIRHLNSAHAGQARVLSIYERGVNRHPGSSPLWREYLAYTAKIQASKRWRTTMTKALRMKPKDAEMWIIAGKRFASHGDMAAARSYFMRGCRFCSADSTLWLEYARCEMQWLQKMERKKKSNAKEIAPASRAANDDDELRLLDSDDEDDEDGRVILPEPTKEEANVIDKQTTKELASNPAMDGAIPIAIFDISRKQPFFNAEVAENFFLLFASFGELSVQARISQHVLDILEEEFRDDPSTCTCYIRQPILGVSPYTPAFPSNLAAVLSRLGPSLESTTDRAALERKTISWVDEYLQLEDLDEGVRKVLEFTKNKLGGSSS